MILEKPFKLHYIQTNNNGQALVENLLIIPVLVVIIVMIMFFARIVITKQQLLMAARYGTDLISYTQLDDKQIENEITEYLCGDNVKGRRLDREMLQIKVNPHRFPKIDINNLDQLFTLLDEFYNPGKHTSSVEICYNFYTPPVFSAWGRYMGRSKLPRSISISARSEVLAGTGA